MASYEILGYTNPIGTNCSPLITIIMDLNNEVCAQFPDSSIKKLVFKKNQGYSNIKGIILEDRNLRISDDQYSYIDHDGQIHIENSEKMLLIIENDLNKIKSTDHEMYEDLRFFFLQEKEELEGSYKNSIIPLLITRKKNSKKNSYIIKCPIITEKSEILSEISESPKYTFEVHKKANKIEILKAIEDLFDVSVKKVNTLNTPSKTYTRNFRGKIINGRKSGYKKAIVTLYPGEQIDFYGDLVA